MPEHAPRMREHHVTVSRTARYLILGDMAAPSDVWFVCHGYGQLAARFLRRFAPIAVGNRVVVAPEALSRFYLDDAGREHGPNSVVGASWMTREDRLAEIDDYVRYLDVVRAQVTPETGTTGPRAVVLGFSQGVATASRWVARGAAPVDALILWGAYLPPELDGDALEPLRRAVVTVVVGEQDPAASRLADEQRRLAGLGVPHRVVRFPGGHEVDRATLLRLGREIVS